MVYFIKCSSSVIHFNEQLKLTFINASYLSAVIHTRDTDVNETKVIFVLMQHHLMRNTDIKKEITSVVRIKKSLSVGCPECSEIIWGNLALTISVSFSYVLNFLSNHFFHN